MNLLTNWFTDELFDHESATHIISPFSRVFCDVERFPDDAQEVMTQYGMGILYTKTDDGQNLRLVTPELRKQIKQNFYDSHHRAFVKAVDEALEVKGEMLILDCRSYCDTPFNRDLILT